MSQQLINRSSDLRRLIDDGLSVEVRAGYILIKNVPYLNRKKEVKYGTLVSTLTLAGEVTTVPDDHQAHLEGEEPCDKHGSPLAKIINVANNRRELSPGIFVDQSFSAKPTTGRYQNYHEKMMNYVNILWGPARELSPDCTPLRFESHEVVGVGVSESPFHYSDTATSRAGIGVINAKLEGSKVAIIGLGGTGSYLLDLVAKAPVKEIHLFDGDMYLQHNAFRSPGATSIDDLKKQLKKTDYYAEIYSKMRKGVVSNPVYVEASNIELLKEMDFVFICIDRGDARKLIVNKLNEFDVDFIDVGMGLYVTDSKVGGVVRTSTRTKYSKDEITRTMSFGDSEEFNEYSTNIQIPDLNCLNATLAVIKWKKLKGFYQDLDREHHSTYTIDGNIINNAFKKEE